MTANDSKYGGMSAMAAQRSHESWVRNGRKPLPIQPDPPESDEQIALRKRQIEVQLEECEGAIAQAVAWYRGWKTRRVSRGFRCVERQRAL